MNKTIAFTAVLILTGSQAEAGPSADDAIRTAVARFIEAGDKQDAQAVGRLTAPEFRVVFQVNGANGTTVLNRDTYRKMLTEGKLGGQPRQVEVRAVRQHGRLAHVELKLHRADATFDGVMTLVADDKDWKVIQDAVRLTKK